MSSRKYARVIEWLLDTDNASVRYFTLRDLLDRKASDPELKEAKAAIPQSRIVSKIFSKQHKKGYWEKPWDPYNPKYRASYWTLMTLAQLGVDRSDKRMSRACDFIFQFQHAEGGFSSQTKRTALREYDWSLKRGKQLPARSEWISRCIYEGQISCLTGNIVAALIRFGYMNSRPIHRALQWLTKIQNRDGGWLCPYWRAHIKDTHGCLYGTICPLEAFSEVPRKNLTREMRQTIKRGAEFLLMHRLYRADHHNYKVIRKSWLKLGFPFFYGYSILRGLDVLTRLGYTRDKRLHDAVRVLLRKQTCEGKWILENTPSGRMHVNLETKGKPSKWITLVALKICRRLRKTECL